MVGTAAGLVGPAIQVVKWVSAPILRQFNYLCCFSANITILKNEAQKLQVTEGDLQGKVDTARNDVRVISGEVGTWLQNSRDIKDEMDGILNEVPNVGSGCLKLRARFSLNKRAKKTTDRLRELRDQCKFDADAISRPRPPASTEAVPSQRTYEFESRKKIEEDIMSALRGEDVKMMGICGMGGLGKTTMAKRIMNRALEEHVFEEVVMAVVSQPTDELKIQVEIGGSLGLELEGKTWQTRVQKLHARLSGPKRILLVLDDVWERLQPGDLGIPCGHKGCTILLTSRNRDVLNAMNVREVFGMTVLSEEDSWLLFRETVGTCVDNIAKEVVNECKGLPIALIAVGALLKDEVNVSIWEDALRQLRQSDPDIPELISNVYNPLKLSYDVLGSKLKSVFLLCCLFPEDADIPLERLTYFCMGLGIFEGGIRNVEEARNRMLALIKMLKSRCLLLDSNKGDDHVRMHDVVRDVCIFIAKQEGYIGDHDHCTWISSSHRSELPMGLALSNLRLLFFFGAHKYWKKKFTLDNSFLQRTRDLSMICIERYSLVSLPHTTQKLINLNTLVLDSCQRVETLSVVGELVNLEILICRDCDSIGELPPEIKGLKRLKVLDLTECTNLKRIGRGIISSLVGLEELKMLKSFKKWEAEDREERENAGLKELGQLPNLRCLEIEIEDLALAAENIRLSSEIDRFTIKFLYENYLFSKFGEYLSNKKICLKWEGATCLGDWIKMQLLRDTECLLLVGNGANEVGVTNLEKIRYLELGECESMKKVVTSSMDKGGATVFPSIENLLLFNLPKLEEICDDRISSNSFQNLKILKLDDLPVLKQLWMSSQNDLGKDFLPQLEGLYIRYCGMMETVFLWKGEDGNENTSCHHITKIFPKLKKLELEQLPNLISLCQGIEGIEFPLLKSIWISECKKMKGMSANGVTNNENNSGGTHHIFCESRVSFGCLKKLNTDRNPFCSHTIHVSIFNGLEELAISTCAGSRSLFTSSMAGNLVNLKVLWISNCDEMVEVIKDDEEKGMSDGRQMALLFPKLQKLMLWNLPKLVSFCESKGIESIQFPKLHTLKLEYLPKLVRFCESKGIESIQFPVLRIMEITGGEKMKGRVANGVTSNENNSGGSNAADTIHLFCESQQVSFGFLKKLDTDWNSFSELKELSIFKCAGILSLFTFSMAGNLVNLKALSIRDCEEMVEVIKGDEENDMSGGQRTLLFPKLKKLELSSLPKLVSFGCLKKLDPDRNSLSELEELIISGCQGILSLFTSSMAGNLVNLKELWIEDCVKMVEVIKDDEEKGMSGGQRTLLFPKLQKLELRDLPKLVSFCESKGIESIQFPVLRIMKITECEKMKGMVANGVTSNENSGGSSTNAAHIIHLFCQSKQVSFGWLKKLDTDRNSFSELEELKIFGCQSILSLFTSSMAGNLVNLKELWIMRCDEMVEVIKDDEEKGMSGGGQRALLFPKLHRLSLWHLLDLVSFCKWECDLKFPSLRRVDICNCPNMKNFTLGSLAAPNLECFETDLKDYLLQVLPFNTPKELSVLENEKPLNCYQIHGSVFDRLEELDIRLYEGSMSLFSSSITGNLVNLTTLTIAHCYGNMVKLIEEEEEKEKVVSGAQRTTILFPKLQKLELSYLPSLVRFCEWKCDVELPSLTEVEINSCHNMQSFTLGHLNTPKLKSVEIDDEEFGGVKDLNGFLQQQYLSRAEEE